MFNLFKKNALKTIDRPKLNSEIEQFDLSGISGDDKNNIIISLTSFPQRMYEIHYTLYSLLTQSAKPSKVILWLAKDQFPNGEKDIPQSVLKLKDNGLSIEWCNNIYSYKKLIPALKTYQDKIIVTADDDIYYEKDWLEKLIDGHNEHKNCIICHRAHHIKLHNNEIAPYKKWTKKIKGGKQPSFLNFQTGAGGVLYPPKTLYKDFADEKLFMELAPKGDDIWFWAMAVLQETKIYITKENIKELTYINPERERGLTNETTLFSFNKKGGNDEQLHNVLNHYPKILEILNN